MSRKELEGTTSRSAIILGMTNTDQVGLWQAGPRGAQAAEVLPDAGDGADDAGDAGEERNEMGLTAAEQAEFDAMRTGDAPADGEDAPAEGDEVDDDGTDDGDDAEAQDPPEQQAQQPKPGEKQQQQPEKAPPKKINYSKYQRELKKANDARAAIEQQLAKEREDRIKLATRVEMINEALSQRQAPAAQQQEEQQAPKNPFEEPDIDPQEDFAAAIAQINRRQRYQLEAQQQTQQVFEETSEDAQIKDTFTRDFSAYASKEPAIHGAYQHLKDARLTQICLGEFGKDPNDPNEQFTPQEVQRMVAMFNAEEKWLVGKAIKERRSPAAAIMSMAKTFGFNPDAWKAAQQQQQQPPAAQPPAKQQQKPPARQQQQPPQEQQPDALQQLRQLQKNVEDGRSLSDGGGAPPPTGITAEMILRLGDEEFAELVDSMPEYQLNQIMGRVPM